jgi:hypothetical protein
MPRIENRMQMPPGLGVPSRIQDKLRQGPPYRPLPANQYGPSVKTVGKGSLIHFNYLFYIHDPYPLVIITDIFPQYVRGVNLHYLTFPYIRRLLQPNCDNQGFSYYNIKGDQYIVDAFRTYKRRGIRNLKSLDCAFILNVLASVRSFDPEEIENLRRIVQEQIQQRFQPRAERMTERYIPMMQGQQPGMAAAPPPPPE